MPSQDKKIADLDGFRQTKGVLQQIGDKGVLRQRPTNVEGKNMTTESYSKETVDAKLEGLESKVAAIEANINGKMAVLESKIDNLPDKFKLALLENNANFRKELQDAENNRKSNKIAIWAIVVSSIISALGVLLPILYTWLTSTK
jgi:hypothetical protein